MASTINASLSSGIVQTADTSGVLQLQTNGTTALSISTGQVVTLTNALPTGSGGTGLTTVGTNGQVLQSNGTNLQWSTPSAGAMTLISTQTASNSASIIWTGLTLDKYLLVWTGVKPATTTQRFQALIGYGATPTYLTSNYNTQGLLSDPTQIAQQTGNGNQFDLSLFTTTTGTQFNGHALFSGFLNNNSATPASYSGLAYFTDANGNAFASFAGYQGSYSGQVTALKIAFVSGNITQGSFSLYGISS